MKSILIQFVVIGLASLIVGFSANALRGKAALQVSKNYFDTGADLIAEAKQRALESAGDDGDKSDVVPTAESDITTSTATMSNARDAIQAEPKGGGGHLEHDYQTISFEDLAEILDNPMTQAGLNVIVDARSVQAFEDGHIPGALHCNPYAVADSIDRHVGGQTMLDAVTAAEKVVVYCGGGDCEDSIFMSRELLELGVSYAAIYLYEGGWKEWSAQGGTIEKGAD